MRQNLRNNFVISSIFLFLGVNHIAFARSCYCPYEKSLVRSFEESEVIFSGKVVQIKRNGYDTEVLLDVLENFKGVDGMQITIYGSSQYCPAYSFLEHESYLVYAVKGKENKYFISSCSRTCKLDSGAQDIAALKEARGTLDLNSWKQKYKHVKSPIEEGI